MSSSETYHPLAPPPSSLPVKPPDPTPDIHDTDIAETSSPRMPFLESLMRDQERAKDRQPIVDLVEAGVVRMSFVDGNRLHPSFELDKNYYKQLCLPWRDSLILRVLGRDIGYKALHTRLVQIWQPKGQLDLLDLGAGCFLARLSQSDDIERVIKRGPWMVQGHYLTVRQWFPKFRPELDVIKRTLPLVRLPGLPLMYYDDDFLETAARGVGCPIRVDSNTSTASRALYARMCMEIDLTLTLVPDVTTRGEHFKVHYEGLHTICMSCGTYGHNASACTSPLKCSAPISGAAVSDQMD
ncbi:hypothetical protein Tsubulata_050763 [Turnera subulata]|uniref:DUF4283 domain-containing protein n=1 Tax=Turnera subulata TaxID=218843 RepID=A0A9Q0F2Y5_9ROSI|nr:hypothetical protein Tsubulata_050763 [Turnera subulata]